MQYKKVTFNFGRPLTLTLRLDQGKRSLIYGAERLNMLSVGHL